MSDTTLLALALTALTLGSLHTLLGPDHYVPFLALARSGSWSLRKTLAITALCGVGHVLSSVIIGLVGVAAGLALHRVKGLEGTRGTFATWALIAFGLGYGVWGLWHAWRHRPHVHVHEHEDGAAHTHVHDHATTHLHPHGGQRTVWILFIVFVLGPCEPLIPILMYPAAQHDWSALVLVTAVFGLTTLLTMTAIVAAGWYGLRAVVLGRLERWVHALAGGVLALSGVVVLFLGV
jgi:nickel/cobalt transporter (NicO) family protein